MNEPTTDLDGMQAKLVAAIAARLEAPPDVVAPDPDRAAATRERLRDLAGQQVRLTIPGDVVLDADGMPAGMTAPTTAIIRLPEDLGDNSDD